MYRIVFFDFAERDDFRQDALFVAKSCKRVSPLLDALIVGSDDEIVAAIEIIVDDIPDFIIMITYVKMTLSINIRDVNIY